MNDQSGPSPLRHDATGPAAPGGSAQILGRAGAAAGVAVVSGADDQNKRLRAAANALARHSLDEADRLLKQLKAEMPGNGDVQRLLGIAALRRGKLTSADRYFRRAIKLQPTNAEYHLSLAQLQRTRQHYQAAKKTLQKAIKLDPEMAPAYGNLGNVLGDLEEWEAAELSYARALALLPNDQTLYENYVRTLAMQGPGRVGDCLHLIEQSAEAGMDTHALYLRAGAKFMELLHWSPAIQVFAEGLQHHAECSDLVIGLGKSLLARQSPADAAVLFREALEEHPDHADMLDAYAAALVQSGKPEEARDALRKRLDQDPDNAHALSNMAVVHKKLDEIEEAEACARKAVALDPSLALPRGVLSDVLSQKGEFEEAIAHLQAGVDATETTTTIFYQLVRTKKDIDEDQDVAAILSSLHDHENITTEQLLFYNFALAEAFHKLKSPERAQFYFRAGNNLKNFQYRAGGIGYNRKKVEQTTNALKNVVTRELLDRYRDAGHESARPIFIVGMPRSGTTLTEQIISSHPSVYGAGELNLFSQAIHHVAEELQTSGREVRYPGFFRDLTGEQLRSVGERYLASIAEIENESAHVTDKMPHNFRSLGLIALAFPNATLIHCRRDPIDTCLSCWQQNFAMPHTYSTDLSDLGHHYREYERLMDHWRAILGERLYEIQYEDLVADQETKSRELIAHCGLEWDDRCLEFNTQKRQVKTASVVQVRQGIYTSSISKWRPYAPYLGELFEALGLDPEEMKKIAAET